MTKFNIVPEAKIKLVAKENPRRPDTKAFKLFALYRTGMTVAAYQKAVLGTRGIRPRRARTSLVHDLKRGFVALETPKKAKAA